MILFCCVLSKGVFNITCSCARHCKMEGVYVFVYGQRALMHSLFVRGNLRQVMYSKTNCQASVGEEAPGFFTLPEHFLSFVVFLVLH